MLKVWLNDGLVPENRAKVSVYDHGFLYGDGIYETLLAREGVVIKVSEHYARLKRSASLIMLRLPFAREGFRDILYRSLDGNRLSNAYLRVTVSRGPGLIGLDPSLCPSPTVVVFARPLVPHPPGLYTRGVRVIVSSVRRNLREAINPEIKSLNSLNTILAKVEAKRRRAFEAVLLNVRGQVTEGTITNIFMGRGDVLMTPSVESGLLNGITRMTVRELAGRLGVRVQERAITLRDLYGADEVFITNTTLGIMPVRQVDGVRYRVGRLTSLMAAEYEKEVAREVAKGRR